MQLDLTTISTLVGMVSVVIGVIVSLHSIWRFIKAQKLATFLEFHKLLYDKEFIKEINEIETWAWKNVEEFYANYGPVKNPDAFAKFIRVITFFDGLCTLVQRRFMDYHFVPETTVIMLIRFWEKFEPTADVLAKVWRRLGAWDAIKHVYNRLHKTDEPYPHPE